MTIEGSLFDIIGYSREYFQNGNYIKFYSVTDCFFLNRLCDCLDLKNKCYEDNTGSEWNKMGWEYKIK